MLEHPRQVGHVILRDIFGRRTPLAVAAAAHVNRNHVIPRRQMRPERVECVRVAGQPMHAYDPRSALVAVVDIMKPKTVRADEFVRCHLFFFAVAFGCVPRDPRTANFSASSSSAPAFSYHKRSNCREGGTPLVFSPFLRLLSPPP